MFLQRLYKGEKTETELKTRPVLDRFQDSSKTGSGISFFAAFLAAFLTPFL